MKVVLSVLQGKRLVDQWKKETLESIQNNLGLLVGNSSETVALVYGKGQNGFPGGSDGKESACQRRRCGFDPWVEKTPWRRKWQPTPVFLPGEPHGLAGYSPWGHWVRHDLVTKQQTRQDGSVHGSGDNTHA